MKKKRNGVGMGQRREVTYKGVTYSSVNECAKALGLSTTAICQACPPGCKYVSESVIEKIMKGSINHKQVTINGVSYRSLSAWRESIGMSEGFYNTRKHIMTPEEIEKAYNDYKKHPRKKYNTTKMEETIDYTQEEKVGIPHYAIRELFKNFKVGDKIKIHNYRYAAEYGKIVGFYPRFISIEIKKPRGSYIESFLYPHLAIANGLLKGAQT